MQFKLRGEHIALCDLLRLTGMTNRGGHGKALLGAGEVAVGGQVELRKTAKIRTGQIVACLGQTVLVMAHA